MKAKRQVLRWLVSILVILFLLRFSFWPRLVDGQSMKPTLNHKDLVITSQLPILLGSYKQGDIVIVETDVDSGSYLIVKRIIATEGMHIVIKDNQVIVDGQVLKEAYIMGRSIGEVDYYVPVNHCFILGDNREVSEDSRYFGTISSDSVKEIVMLY